VNEKHGGTVTFTTDPGVGTTFFIRIPIDDAGAQHPALDAAE
jgi:signal transduction histidine kinase